MKHLPRVIAENDAAAAGSLANLLTRQYIRTPNFQKIR